MTTIKDIAEYAGVSATTVSNVIHGKKNRVSQETIDRIQNAIEELNYVPNMFARSLVSSTSRVIALINHVPTRSDATFSDDTFQMAFLSTMESILREKDYYLMFRHVETGDELQMFLQNWNVDGLFLTGICDKQFLDSLPKLRVPTVVIDSFEYVGDTVFVGLEDEEGGYLATKYMIDNGHKRIAYTTSAIHDGYVMKARFDGYKRALTEAGIRFDNKLVFEGDIDLASCKKMANDISTISDVTAVVSSTDIMAAGIMAGFNDMGKKVPDDISVIGFDDSALCQMVMPPLTSIKQDMVAKAATASKCMLKMLSGEPIEEKKIKLPVELIERKSVAKIG